MSICVDDQAPPFTFVTVHGNAEIKHYKKRGLLNWPTRIAERYMGKKKAKVYGRRNSTEGSVLVRIRPIRITAEKNIAD